jgi:hypothetical protein
MRCPTFLVEMAAQVVYKSNFDYHATYEKLRQSTVGALDVTQKGLIWFKFYGTRTVFLLTPGGFIQVKWSDPEEKKVLFKVFKGLLVPAAGKKLTVKPLKQQLWVDYPAPPDFKIYWCETETEYAKQAEFEPSLLKSVRKAVEELRRQLFFLREPTVTEVALKTGRTPETVRPILYKLAPKIGWREQGGEEAEKEAEEAVNLAGWLSWLKKGEENQELRWRAEEAVGKAPPNVVERAEKILENFPEMAPEAKPSSRKVSDTGRFFTSAGLAAWPEEAKKAWRRAFLKESPSSASGSRTFFGIAKSPW